MNQKITLKTVLLRGLLGFPIGVCIGYTITIFTSLCFAGVSGGAYIPLTPTFSTQVSYELVGVIITYFAYGLLGFFCAASSAIFLVERISIAARTSLHFGLLLLVMLPLGYTLGWFNSNPWSLLLFFIFFLVAYVIMSLIEYRIYFNMVKKTNEKLKESQQNREK